MAEPTWYYTDGIIRTGPISLEEIQRLALDHPEMLVWEIGMENWVPAGSVTEFANSPVPDSVQTGRLNYFRQDPIAARLFTPAGFWLRLIAMIVDWVVLGLPLSAVSAWFFSPAPVFLPGRTPSLPPLSFIFIFGAPFYWTVIAWLYFSLMESSIYQATLGKMIVGLKVVDLQGRRISFGRATGRFFAKTLSAVILYIGFLMAAGTRYKQALHDQITNTLVVMK